MYTMIRQSATPDTKGKSERPPYPKVLVSPGRGSKKFRIGAAEVSLPHRCFRFDLAALKPRCRVPEKVDFEEEPGTAAVFECKQSRP